VVFLHGDAEGNGGGVAHGAHGEEVPLMPVFPLHSTTGRAQAWKDGLHQGMLYNIYLL